MSRCLKGPTKEAERVQEGVEKTQQSHAAWLWKNQSMGVENFLYSRASVKGRNRRGMRYRG